MGKMKRKAADKTLEQHLLKNLDPQAKTPVNLS